MRTRSLSLSLSLSLSVWRTMSESNTLSQCPLSAVPAAAFLPPPSPIPAEQLAPPERGNRTEGTTEGSTQQHTYHGRPQISAPRSESLRP